MSPPPQASCRYRIGATTPPPRHNSCISEGIWFELKENGVDVLALCPSSTQTEFAQVAGIQLQGGKAGRVVSAALRGLGRKVVVVPGLGNIIATLFSRLLTHRHSVLFGALVVEKQNRGAG